MKKWLIKAMGWSLVLSACQTTPDESSVPPETLFSLLTTEATGIAFINQIEDTQDFNILNYRNFYNGAGVAIGDVNGDSLPDIYFTANQNTNKLFLNKGDWKFEDITNKAGVAGTKAWSTGVTMVDVNSDGWLDIYVCNSGDLAGDNKENELFINNGDDTFSEQAKQWGLNSGGFSTHASFFDYDGDGDLDCYLLNNSFKSPDRIEFYRKSRGDVDQEGGDKLLRNEGDHFSDVTVKAGIYTSDIGFGLGVSISDLNNDMLPDIYVSNDFWERDYLYINKGDGTFSEELEERVSICSMNSMGADIADLDNSNGPEIMTTDMLPPDNYRLKTMTQFEPVHVEANKNQASYHHQMMQNALHLNNGQAQFQEVAFMSQVAATDWSWGALILDLDLDGRKDIFISNGILKDLTDFDFVDFITDQQEVEQLVTKSNRADFRDFLPHMPSTKLANYAFLNQGNIGFVNKANELGLATPSFSNGAAYGDLDNDGDLDLVINNANMPCFVYRNNSRQKNDNGFLKVALTGPAQNPLGIGAKVSIRCAGQTQELQHYLSRGYESSVAPGLLFGLGEVERIDSVVVTWPDHKLQALTNIVANQTLHLIYADAVDQPSPTPNTGAPILVDYTEKIFPVPIRHQENDFNDFDYERLLPHKLSAEGPKLIVGDVNGDQMEDFFLLGAADQPNQLLLQKKDGTFTPDKQKVFLDDQRLESTCGTLFDADGDKDLDLIVGHGGNEYQKGIKNFGVRFYENNGQGQFLHNQIKSPPVGGNLSCIEPCDFDGDGDLDLFLGGRAVPGNYGLIPTSFLLENQGDGTWKNITDETIGTLGMVTAAAWTDVDADQDQDLVIVGEWMPIAILENVDGVIQNKSSVANSSGWWSALEAVDLDNDGDEDLIAGNWGLNSKFRASSEFPIKMHVGDFDVNGKTEPIIESYSPADTTSYPFASKMDLTTQLPQLKKQVLKYSDFAQATYNQLFDVSIRNQALSFKVSNLSTAILWNEPSGFKLEALNQEAQVAPVFSIIAEDLDQDQRKDLLLLGNQYGLKPEVGRLDANRGVFLKGNENRKFVSSEPTGIRISGEVRDAKVLTLANGKKVLLVARNNLPMQAFLIE